MKQFRLKKKLKPLRGIELAPLIDVISFIVIYFLMNSTLEKGTTIKVQLPKSSSIAKTRKMDQIIISVNAQGLVFMDNNETPIPVEELTGEIQKMTGDAAKKEKSQVIIRADGTANYQTVIKVIDQINAAGIKKFNLAMTKQGK